MFKTSMMTGLMVGLLWMAGSASVWADNHAATAEASDANAIVEVADANEDTVASLAPGVPEVGATSFLLVDFQSGDELASLNPGKQVEPASITKLMTAYILYRDLASGKISEDDEVLVSEKAWKMQGSRMFINVGKKVKLELLLKGLIIQSGNDAAVALAEHVAGSEEAFVARMNDVAQELGMRDTNYENVTGWPSKTHVTSARDIVTLTKAMIMEFPERYKLYAQKEFTYNKIKQHNRNKLLWRDDSVDGVKTGHTESAGYCLVSSAKRNNMRLISVVLGTVSEDARAEASQKLLEYGFRTFETHQLYSASDVLSEVRIWKGEKETVPAGVMMDLAITMPKGRYEKLSGSAQYDKAVDAPIKRGDVLGKVILSDEGKVLKEVPLLAMEDVAEGGLWRRMSDTIQKLFAD